MKQIMIIAPCPSKKNVINSKYFKYKASITRGTYNVAATVKDYEENKKGNCVITSSEKRLVTAAQGNNPAVYDYSPKNATFKITDTKFYISVVTLSAENDNRLFEQLATGFKRTTKWNKYRSKIPNKTGNNNSIYLTDLTFIHVNRIFVLFFENGADRISF